MWGPVLVRPVQLGGVECGTLPPPGMGSTNMLYRVHMGVHRSLGFVHSVIVVLTKMLSLSSLLGSQDSVSQFASAIFQLLH